MEKAVILGVGDSYQLSLSGVKNYVAVWSVENNGVLTVDRNGKITARQAGVARVTVRIGSTVLQCEVVVRESSQDSENELPLVPYY